MDAYVMIAEEGGPQAITGLSDDEIEIVSIERAPDVLAPELPR